MIKPTRYKSRAKARRHARNVTKATLLFLAVLVVVGGLAVFVNMSFWQIKDIDVSGVEAVSPKDVEDIVDGEISGNIWFFIPKRNILATPIASIEESILSAFPKVKEVSVKRHSLSKLGISVTERKPFAIWCPGDQLTECQLMDADGFVFAQAGQFLQNTFIVFEDAGTAKASGFQFIEPEKFGLIKTFLSGLRDLQLEPEKVTINGSDISVNVSSRSKILFSIEGDIEKIFSNLQSVLSDADLSLMEDGILQTEYIDLRFGNKVFYKLIKE